MKIWFVLPFAPTLELLDFAAALEGVGCTGVAIPEHLVAPEQLVSPYPYSSDHSARIPAGLEYPDSLVLSASIAARTSQLRLMTYVMIAPLRHPILLAKQVATTAIVSGGRLDLGVGVGWMREEFDAIGVDFSTRGSRFDEMLMVLRGLWSGETIEHRGQHFAFDRVSSHPTPCSRVDVFIGGESGPAIRRAALMGEGWIGVGSPVERIGEVLAQLQEARRQAGTMERPFEVRTQVKGRLTPDRVRELKRLKVDGLILSSWNVAPSDDPLKPAPLEEIIKKLPTVQEQIAAVSTERA